MNIRNVFKLTSAALALLGSVAVANAADLAMAPVEPAPPIVYAFSWTGFYVGANIGYGFGGDDRVGERSDFGSNFPNVDKFELSGVFGGLQGGYNYQMGSFVFGLEADIQAAGIDDDINASTGIIDWTGKSELNWFGTVRPRIGFAWDRALIYATGGVAFGGVDYKIHADDGFTTLDQKNDDTLVGYAVGAGVEYAFTDNWTAKLEYQYVNFGSENVSGTTADGSAVWTTVETPDFHSVRLGINYKF